MLLMSPKSQVHIDSHSFEVNLKLLCVFLKHNSSPSRRLESPSLVDDVSLYFCVADGLHSRLYYLNWGSICWSGWLTLSYATSLMPMMWALK